jgi:hypothetical protein
MPRIDVWNILFMLFFVLLTYVGYEIVLTSGHLPLWISPWDMFILALATLRLTRLVVYDSIMLWFRDLFEPAAPYSFLATIRTLVNCPWCTGLWFALVVSVVFFAWPQLWFFIFILALGGAATMLQIATNWLGWNAEHTKRATVASSERDYGGKCG